MWIERVFEKKFFDCGRNVRRRVGGGTKMIDEGGRNGYEGARDRETSKWTRRATEELLQTAENLRWWGKK